MLYEATEPISRRRRHKLNEATEPISCRQQPPNQEPGPGGHGPHPSGGLWTRSVPTLMQLLPSTSSIAGSTGRPEVLPNAGPIQAS